MRLIKFLLICCLVQLLCSPLLAQDKIPSLVEVRKAINKHLEDEITKFDSKNTSRQYEDIYFHRQNNSFDLSFKQGKEKISLSLSLIAYSTEDYNHTVAMFANHEISKDYFEVKISEVTAQDNNSIVKISVDWESPSIEQIELSIDYWTSQLVSVRNALITKIEEYQSVLDEQRVPFSVLSCDVRNVDNELYVISDYNEKLNSVVTKYFQPRLLINSSNEETCPIFVKLIESNGKLSTGMNSPVDYTYSINIALQKGAHSYVIGTWGSNTYGKWPAGNYRLEFYCRGKHIYTKHFTVY